LAQENGIRRAKVSPTSLATASHCKASSSAHSTRRRANAIPHLTVQRPEAHYSNGWLTLYHSLGQVAAAREWRSSIPTIAAHRLRRRVFHEGQKEAGGKEFDDLIDGVDHLIKMGLVDEKKVGITAAVTAATRPPGARPITRTVSLRGHVRRHQQLISCSGTTDIPQEMFLVHHRKWLWDDWDYFAKASRSSISTSTRRVVIMHGKADRASTRQSLEFYRHLKVRNQAPVRLSSTGEGHATAGQRPGSITTSSFAVDGALPEGPRRRHAAMDIDYGLTPTAKTSSNSWDNVATV